jgi:membrane associated rhomboid family serine protease
MSGDENPQSDQSPAAGPAQRQPVFLLPWPVTALCGLLIAIQLTSDLILNDSGREALLTWLAFVPYRLIAPNEIDGGWLPLIWTPFTHAFLHGGWEHVGLNAVWLAIFGTPIAQRYGAVRMYILFLIGAALGAAAFAATTLPHVQILVGASGGVAALTGAAVRFIFQPPMVAVDEATGERHLVGRKLATLSEFIRNPTARFFSLVWLVLNGLVPLVPLFMAGQSVQIAWQTHIAGFLAGLLLVPLLERRQT